MDLIFYQIATGLLLTLATLLSYKLFQQSKQLNRTKTNHKFLQKVILEAKTPMMICKDDFSPVFINNSLRETFKIAEEVKQKDAFTFIQTQLQKAIHTITFDKHSDDRVVQINKHSYSFKSQKVKDLSLIEFIIHPQNKSQRSQELTNEALGEGARLIDLFDLLESTIEKNLNYLSSKKVFLDIKSPTKKITTVLNNQDKIEDCITSLLQSLVPLVKEKNSKKISCEIDENGDQKVIKFFAQNYRFQPSDLYLNRTGETESQNLPNLIQRFEYIEKLLNSMQAKISLNLVKDFNQNILGTEVALSFIEPNLSGVKSVQINSQPLSH
ncbi:hypothetical protein N9N67_08915 [Bacteriovoracaceae bacterium]|nr:hypothetical protein [Bacteriovoracaceae bacterium]